jgi:hypothetical protein
MRSFDHRIRSIEVYHHISTASRQPFAETSLLLNTERRGIRTDVRPEISSSLHLDMQILIHFADNLYRVADGEV